MPGLQDPERPAASLQGGTTLGAAAPVASEVRMRRRSHLKLTAAERCLFYLMVAFVHLLSLLPDFVLYPLGVLAGLIAFRLDSRHVAVGLRNLEIAFPDRALEQRRRILRDSYANLGRSIADYVRLGGFFYRRMARKVHYERIEVWEEALRRYPGRGILVLGAHFGNFELLAPVHALHGYRISLVHHTQRFLPGDALVTFVRERAGVEIIRKHSAARAVLRALREGEMVGIPFDQNARRSEAVFVPFFSQLAATSGGLARVVRMSGAMVVPVFIVRDANRRTHRIVIQEEIPIQHTADLEADIHENTRRFVAAIEQMVRAHPDQFLWIHRRFRTRPRGAPPIYDEPRRPIRYPKARA